MENWFFTFGGGQPLKDYYVIIMAENGAIARHMMLHQFGQVWSGQYSQEDWNRSSEKYFGGLLRIGPLVADDERYAEPRARGTYQGKCTRCGDPSAAHP